jgi:uncharacterized protein YjiS (DUF1127 family)
MNVELINPTLVLGLFASHDADKPRSSQWQAPAWARQVRASFHQKVRYRRALHELRQLDDRELDGLNLAHADLPALAWRHANGFEPLARA